MIKQQRRTDTHTCKQIFAMVWLAVLIMLGLGTIPVHAQGWPTKQFVITKHNPDTWMNLPDWVPGAGFSDEQEKVIRDFEKYLSQVAAHYESMGFRAPKLPMTKNDSAYAVYVYDFPPGETTALSGYFPDGSVNLRLDLSLAIVNGKPSERAYEDLAHELFHNVQRAYQSAYALDHDSWITEGQAQAVGVDTAYKLRNVMRFKTTEQTYRLGGRPYYKPLTKAIEEEDEDYRTSSFWRYIGEHYAASKKDQHAGVKPIPADYGYLAKVLAHPFKGPSSRAADLRWLDRALKQELGLGLNRLYANFITTFAEYVPERLHKMSSTPDKAASKWWKYIFDGCEVVMPMSPSSPTGRVELDLDRNAAGCFLVNAQGVMSTDWEIDIAITARSGSPEALKALHIGTDGGQKVGLPRIVGMSKGGGGGYLGHWRFRIRTGQRQVFVISNVAEDAEKSKPQKVVLDLTISTWGSNMTKPVPQKAPPKKKTPKVKGAKKTDVGTKPDEGSADLNYLTATSALGTEVRMEAYNPGCKEPFRFKPCGPALSIGLSLTPGSLVASDLFKTGSRGGWFGQMHNIVKSKAAIIKGYEDYAGRVSQMEGVHVDIQIPDISYGFTGSFNNARISVSGRDDTNYVSIGPQNVTPRGMHAHYPLSGQVSIEEFTPAALRGRFAARLVDMDRVKPGTQTLPTHKTISGQFVITAPWEGDPNIERMVPSAESSLQSLTEASPFAFGGGLEELARRHDIPITRSGPAGQSSGKSGGSAAGATFPRVQSCDCTCQPLESYSSYCRPICSVKAHSCQIEELQATADRQALSEAKVQTKRKQAREAKLASLNDTDKRDYVAYLFLLGFAQMTHGVSDSTKTAEEMTRSEFQSYLESSDTDKIDMQKMLDFFDQEHTAGTP
ncbi:hypothetical protein [Pusillimonas sp. T7-7]|uniref:hypothetical protein n=1 Tax=Pusillimonas sp. (strain T7-7) TaxID=1007105 RepID=UPI00059F0517|nr:hypothetical protein [Pusillimonas sp. T7-7]